MQLQQLAYFVAVADARHFTRAAESLHVAQPSLSQQVRALEADLDTRLFHRLPGRVELTATGEQLLPLARRILADAESVRQVVREVDDLARGRVRLGATPSLCTSVLPGILARFRHEYPGVTLAITEGGSRDLQRLLSEGALDLALIVDARVGEDTRLATLPLFEEELVLISAAAPAAAEERTVGERAAGGRPAGGRPPEGTAAPATPQEGRIQIAALRNRPLVMFRAGYDLRERTVAACTAAGFEPSFAVEGGEMDVVLELVAAGLGSAVVPSVVAGPRFRVERFESPGLSRTVLLALRNDIEAPPAARELHRTIRSYVVEVPGGSPSISALDV